MLNRAFNFKKKGRRKFYEKNIVHWNYYNIFIFNPYISFLLNLLKRLLVLLSQSNSELRGGEAKRVMTELKRCLNYTEQRLIEK